MWAGLVAEEFPVNTEEIDRLNHILKLYEQDNLRLVRENQAKDAIIAANHSKQLQLEKERQTQTKKAKSVEGTLKFERIAAEGLTKKTGVLEMECMLLKEDKLALEDKLCRNDKRLLQLETTFNRDRSKLLQNIHEIELLTIRSQESDERAAKAESDLRVLQTEILSKLQLTETLTAKTDLQQRTVHEQADEMLDLTREVYNLKVRKNELSDLVTQQELKISRYETRIEDLTTEVQRLRRELLDIAHTQSQKSLAYSAGLSDSRVQKRILEGACGDRRVNIKSADVNCPQKIFYPSHSLSPDTPVTMSAGRPYRQPAGPSSVLSSRSTAHRPQTDAFCPSSSQSNANILIGQLSPVSLLSTDGERKVKPTCHQQNLSASAPLLNSTHDELSGMTCRSMFVGSGLGLRQERVPQLNSRKGTAKQILKRIMTTFE